MDGFQIFKRPDKQIYIPGYAECMKNVNLRLYKPIASLNQGKTRGFLFCLCFFCQNLRFKRLFLAEVRTPCPLGMKNYSTSMNSAKKQTKNLGSNLFSAMFQLRLIFTEKPLSGPLLKPPKPQFFSFKGLKHSKYCWYQCLKPLNPLEQKNL